MGRQEGGKGREWEGKRVGRQEGGKARGWEGKRVGRQEDGKGRGWEGKRVGREEDGKGRGWEGSKNDIHKVEVEQKPRWKFYCTKRRTSTEASVETGIPTSSVHVESCFFLLILQCLVQELNGLIVALPSAEQVGIRKD